MIKLSYVGSVVPDKSPYINKAFSRAGNMCQHYLIKGLVNAGLRPSAVFSLRPAVSFPGSSKLFYRSASTVLEDTVTLKFLFFINITPIKQICLGLSTIFSLLSWGWHCRHTRHRIVYAYNISVPPGLFILLGAWLTRSKCIAMIYDIGVPGETCPATLFNKINFWLHYKTLPFFDGLVVITDEIAKDFAPNVPAIRVEGGIKPDLLEQYRSIAGLHSPDPAVFTMVAAGGLDEENGIREIISAFSLLIGEKYQLHIAGAGPLEDFVKTAAISDSRIHFHGFISFADVLKLYASADLLLNIRLTQRMNTRYFFPSKIMECLASGVPVITTCPGNVAEEYADFAFLLRHETPEALADLIQEVESIPSEQRLVRAKAACEYIVSHKTWDAQAKRILMFLHQITGLEQEHTI